MVVVNKIKQLEGLTFEALVLKAKSEGADDNTKIAKWIIAHSPYWRSAGYKRIIEEMEKS